MKINFRPSSAVIVTLAVLTTSLVMLVTSRAAETNIDDGSVDPYTRTIYERAGKIVATLDLADDAKKIRVRDIIARQYRDLSGIHEVRDGKIQAATLERVSTNKVSADDGIKAAGAEAGMKVNQLHGEFLARLSAELSPAQIEKVKDGLTYGVVPLTYGFI